MKLYFQDKTLCLSSNQDLIRAYGKTGNPDLEPEPEPEPELEK